MGSRIRPVGSCLLVLMILLFAGTAASEYVSPRCVTAMDRVARHYSKCLVLANNSYARHGNPMKLEDQQERCLTRFDRRTTRAISSHGAEQCTSADLVRALARRRGVSYAEGIATTSLRGLRDLRASGQVPRVCANVQPPKWACVGCEYPEKNFIEYDIPARVKIGDFYLDALKPADLKEDLEAIREGPESYLKDKFGKKWKNWPMNVTEASDLADLCWHYNAFLQKRSFAWVVRDKERNYLGCAYYFPTLIDSGATPAVDAEAVAWIRFSRSDSPEAPIFYENFEAWINSPIWPNLNVKLMTP